MSIQAQTIAQEHDPLLSSMFSESSLEFASKLPASLVETFAEIQTLEDLVRAIQDIEARQADRKSLRYLSKIKPCLNALNEYSGIIEVFVNAKPDIMAFVWGPIKACLLVHLTFMSMILVLNITPRLPPSTTKLSTLFCQHTSRSKMPCLISLQLSRFSIPTQ
jgi:hypothetical protein